ncbi:xanthine dehydrogenase accessory protein XdhC [Mesorhizobium sp. J428]|uniref:xanthine dehydrogenase accessory protein XdhC n=1 Tax=Mesorhizobium sp. J428 TaxID=2898440 RepID=UPI0021519265|nr:xanthine dehydrogenase accessory protein XdhC [Mesorhizobium sp. J428]MCR5856136.1 xanthine dehydrogenase accessory protein XdhC [Mesorhizobium sp. J428]
MTASRATLARFLDAHPQAALVEVVEALGSTPREKGAWMLVSPDATFETIGGGQLEFMAIDRAREMLAGVAPPFEQLRPAGGETRERLSIPLGPEIGQCCGGRVELSVRVADDRIRAELLRQAEAEEAKLPRILLFGGGHVGHALAAAFALLPVKVIVADVRAEALDGMPPAVDTLLTPMPEEAVRDARPGSAFVVLTHDHALDFLIVAEALKRDDAAYVGMIGSKTKRATFRSWYLKEAGGDEAALSRLVCPIGGDSVRDKRPAVIAALAAAEIMTALSRNSAA